MARRIERPHYFDAARDVAAACYWSQSNEVVRVLLPVPAYLTAANLEVHVKRETLMIKRHGAAWACVPAMLKGRLGGACVPGASSWRLEDAGSGQEVVVELQKELAAPWLVGMEVRIEGLDRRVDLNGQCGVVTSFDAAAGGLGVAVQGESAAVMVRQQHLRLASDEAVRRAAWMHPINPPPSGWKHPDATVTEAATAVTAAPGQIEEELAEAAGDEATPHELMPQPEEPPRPTDQEGPSPDAETAAATIVETSPAPAQPPSQAEVEAAAEAAAEAREAAEEARGDAMEAFHEKVARRVDEARAALAHAAALKAKGNTQLTVEQRPLAALGLYTEAATAIDNLQPPKSPGGEHAASVAAEADRAWGVWEILPTEVREAALELRRDLSNNACKCNMALGRWGEAVQCAKLVLAIEPDNAKALYHRATALLAAADAERRRGPMSEEQAQQHALVLQAARADLEAVRRQQPSNRRVRELLDSPELRGAAAVDEGVV